MPYTVVCWIKVDNREVTVYDTEEEAKEEMKEWQDRQPQNIYQVERID